MNFGSLRLDIVPGGRFRMDGGALFGVVPKVLWERSFPADDRNRVGLAVNCLLVRGPGFCALIETGVGDKHDARDREACAIEETRTLAEELAIRGVSLDEIDALVLSRLRFHQAGGATRRGAHGCVPVFPNATLYVQEAELVHARRPGERDGAAYRPEDWEPYAAASRLEPVAGQREIRPGLTVTPIPGHFPGMQAVRIDSFGMTALYFAEALPTSAHVPIPWTMASDLYPVELIQSKKRLLDRAAAEGWLCVFENDPDVPWGTIVDEVNGRRRVHVLPASQAEYRALGR